MCACTHTRHVTREHVCAHRWERGAEQALRRSTKVNPPPPPTRGVTWGVTWYHVGCHVGCHVGLLNDCGRVCNVNLKVGYTVVRPAVLKDAPRASEDSQKVTPRPVRERECVRERQRHRQTGRERDRERQRERQRETDRQTETDTQPQIHTRPLRPFATSSSSACCRDAHSWSCGCA
eukprot:143837-Rhodomonas_salina.1